MASSGKVVIVVFLISLALAGSLSEVQAPARVRRSLSPSFPEEDRAVDDGQRAYANGDFLETLLASPDKRQWCRNGMTYNHVLGRCTLSYSAMRGRGRGY